MTILEGESLNDAAGIISFKIAVGVLVTGAFSLVDAVQLFLIASIDAAQWLVLLIGMALVRFRLTLMRRGYENINMFTIIQLLTPFVSVFNC